MALGLRRDGDPAFAQVAVPERQDLTQPQPRQKSAERTGPVTYVREVREEMAKVAWPKWPEVRRYSMIVLVTVVVFTAYIGGLDAVFGVFSGWLYKD